MISQAFSMESGVVSAQWGSLWPRVLENCLKSLKQFYYFYRKEGQWEEGRERGERKDQKAGGDLTKRTQK